MKEQSLQSEASTHHDVTHGFVENHSEASSLAPSCRHLVFLEPEVAVLDQRVELGGIMLTGSD